MSDDLNDLIDRHVPTAPAVEMDTCYECDEPMPASDSDRCAACNAKRLAEFMGYWGGSCPTHCYHCKGEGVLDDNHDEMNYPCGSSWEKQYEGYRKDFHRSAACVTLVHNRIVAERDERIAALTQELAAQAETGPAVALAEAVLAAEDLAAQVAAADDDDMIAHRQGAFAMEQAQLAQEQAIERYRAHREMLAAQVQAADAAG